MATGPLEFLAYEISKASISALVKPALTTAFSGLRSLSSAAIEKFGDRFSDYLTTQANRHSCLNTIVFGHQRSLSDLYIPLTVVPTKSIQVDSEKEEILIDRFQTKLLPSETRILITDTAGMGKSTLSKFLFLQSIKSGYAIPIFVELRHLSNTNPILTHIQKQLNIAPISEDQPKFPLRLVERTLKKGGLIIFLDGYDEIPFKDREYVTRDIKEFIEKYPNNHYTITSRPESGLLAFPTFKQFSIRPLTRDESFALIRKYDQGGGRSEQLISKLTGRDFRAVQEFLKNPLLTSLLYRSFEYKQNVPIKKHIFYRQVFDALFDWHDSSKDGYNTREKKSGLDIDSFHRVLRIIGFVSVMKGEVEGDTDTILGWIRKAREVCSTSAFSESDFLDDLIRAVPIFVKDGDYYRWSHKSLAEYFAAQYICTEGKGQQAKILESFISTGRTARFSNVLDQIYDIDVVAFRSHLIIPMAKAFTSFWNSSYHGLNPEISSNSLKLRKEASFDKNLFVLPFDIKTLEDPINGLQNALKDVSGETIDLRNTEINFMLTEGAIKKSRLIGITSGSFTTIARILSSKKDSLVRRRDIVEIPKKGQLPAGITNYKLTDNPKEPSSQPDLFDTFTRYFVDLDVIIDSDKMLAFESSFRDSIRLSELADELLNPMLNEARR